MPNYCTNKLTVNKSAKNLIINKHKEVDFNILLPMPETLNITEGSVMEEAIAVYEYKANRNYKPLYELMSERGYSDNPESYVSQLEFDYAKRKALDTINNGTTYEKKYCFNLYTLGRTYVENKQKYGYYTWYDWCCKTWGTKWNAWGTVIEEDGDNLVITFTTAWCPPENWLLELATKVDYFNLDWDEEGGYYGNIYADHGEVSSVSDLHTYDEEQED